MSFERAITDDGQAFDDNHDDEWEAEGALTDTSNNFDEERREAININFFLFFNIFLIQINDIKICNF